jgi:hypothetical protein
LLFNEPEKIKTMGEKSREIIETEINIHTVLGNYLAAFRFAVKS